MALSHPKTALLDAARRELNLSKQGATPEWVAQFVIVYVDGNTAVRVTEIPFLALLQFLRDNEVAREAFVGAYNMRSIVIDLLYLVVDLYESRET